MRKLYIVFVAAFLMAAAPAPTTQPASQPAATQPIAATASQPAPAVQPVVTPGEPAVKDAPAATVEDLTNPAKDVLDHTKDYLDKAKGGDKAARALALLGLLSAILKLLLAGLRRTSEFWKGDRGKLYLKLITLIVGVVIYFVETLANGQPWYLALTVAMAGPGSILLTEYQKMFPFLRFGKKEEAKPEDKPAEKPAETKPN